MTAHDRLVELSQECLHYARSQEQLSIEFDVSGAEFLSHLALGESSAFFQVHKQLAEENYG